MESSGAGSTTPTDLHPAPTGGCGAYLPTYSSPATPTSTEQVSDTQNNALTIQSAPHPASQSFLPQPRCATHIHPTGRTTPHATTGRVTKQHTKKTVSQRGSGFRPPELSFFLEFLPKSCHSAKHTGRVVSMTMSRSFHNNAGLWTACDGNSPTSIEKIFPPAII